MTWRASGEDRVIRRDGFIEYWAGRKLWVDGREVQGPLGGVLGKMDLKGWSVVKL